MTHQGTEQSSVIPPKQWGMALAQKLWDVYDAWHRKESDSAATLITAAHMIDDFGNQIRAERDAEVMELVEALNDLSSMYSHAWDLVDGGLMMMREVSIPKFEKAHAKAQKVLSKHTKPKDTQ